MIRLVRAALTHYGKRWEELPLPHSDSWRALFPYTQLDDLLNDGGTTRGTMRTRTWTLSPKFYSERLLTHGVSIQSEGYMEQTVVRDAHDDSSNPRVVERDAETAEA
jgi:hypothetical protein